MKSKRDVFETIVAVQLAVIIIAIIAAAFAFPVKWLLNYVLSDSALEAVFSGPLTFWKALALLLVLKLLYWGPGNVEGKQ